MESLFGSGYVIGGAVVAGVIVLVGLLVWATIAWQKKKLAPLARAVNGEIKVDGRDGTCVKFFREGIEIRVGLISGSDSDPSKIALRIFFPLGFHFRIAPEDFLTAQFDQWGLFQDLKVGDPEFDRAFRIKSHQKAQVVNFLSDAVRRGAIRSLFDQGFREFQSEDESVVVYKPNYGTEDVEPSTVQSRLDLLFTLVMGS